MGRKRLGRYLFVWWKGDHPPQHVHVFDNMGRFLGRMRVDTFEGLGGWQPSAQIVRLVQRLRQEGDLWQR